MSTTEEQILETLRDIQKWIRFSGWPNVKNVLVDTLSASEDRIAYDMTDGVTSIRTIMKQTKKSFGYTQGIWKQWTKIGIAEPVPFGKRTRAKALFKLEDFGIEVPKYQKKSEPESEEEIDDEQ